MSDATWRTMLVFVSSTFRDMHAERDVVHDVVEALNEELAHRRCTLVPVDLRWGVDTTRHEEEDAKDAHVLRVCLEEIRRSRPLFLGLLGDRYGWVPDPERLRRALDDAGVDLDADARSVTAVEIAYGVFADPAVAERALFLLRDPLPYERLPPEVRATFSDAHADDPGAAERAAALRDLRDRIERELPDRTERYQLEWDAEAERPRATPELHHRLRDRLREVVLRRLDEEGAAAEADPDRRELDGFLEPRREIILGRDELVDDLVHRLTTPEPIDRDRSWRWWWPQRGAWEGGDSTALVATAGAGKSSVLAAVLRRLEADPGTTVLVHAAGAGPRSASTAAMVARWTRELALHLGDDTAVSADDGVDEAAPDRSRFAALLREAGARGPVVLLIDALDQFTPTPEARHLTFLPEPLPPGVRLLTTVRAGPTADRFAERRGVEWVELPALAQDELTGIVRAVAARHRRELNPRIIDALFEDRDEPTPLWARSTIDALLSLDEDDFAAAGSLPGSAEEQLDQLLLSTARGFPDHEFEVIAQRLARGVDRFGPWVVTVISALSHTRGGLRHEDLLTLLERLGTPTDDLTLARLRRSVRGALVRRDDGRLTFAHDLVRWSAGSWSRRAGSPQDDARVRSALFSHVTSLPVTDPVRVEEELAQVLDHGAADALPAALERARERPGGWYPLVEALRDEPARTISTLAEVAAGSTDAAAVVLHEVVPSVLGHVPTAPLRSLVETVADTLPTGDPVGSHLFDRALLLTAELAWTEGDTDSTRHLATAVLARDAASAHGGVDAGGTVRDHELAVLEAHRLVAAADLASDRAPEGAGDELDRGLDRGRAALLAAPQDVALVRAYTELLLAEARRCLTGEGVAALTAAAAAVDRARDLTSLDPDDQALRGRVEIVAAELARRSGDGERWLATAEDAVQAFDAATRETPDRSTGWEELLEARIDLAAVRVERFRADEVVAELDALDALHRRVHGTIDGGPSGAPAVATPRAAASARRLATLRALVGVDTDDDVLAAEGVARVGRLVHPADGPSVPPPQLGGRRTASFRQLVGQRVAGALQATPDGLPKGAFAMMLLAPLAPVVAAGFVVVVAGILVAFLAGVGALLRFVDVEWLAAVEGVVATFLAVTAAAGRWVAPVAAVVGGAIVSRVAPAQVARARTALRWALADAPAGRTGRRFVRTTLTVVGLLGVALVLLVGALDRWLASLLDVDVLLTSPVTLILTAVVVIGTWAATLGLHERFARETEADSHAHEALATAGWPPADAASTRLARAYPHVFLERQDADTEPGRGAASSAIERTASHLRDAELAVAVGALDRAQVAVLHASAAFADRGRGGEATVPDGDAATARPLRDTDIDVVACRLAAWRIISGVAGDPTAQDRDLEALTGHRARLAELRAPGTRIAETLVLALHADGRADPTQLRQRSTETERLAAQLNGTRTTRGRRIHLVLEEVRATIADERGRWASAGAAASGWIGLELRDREQRIALPSLTVPPAFDPSTTQRSAGRVRRLARTARRLATGVVDSVRMFWRYRVEAVPIAAGLAVLLATVAWVVAPGVSAWLSAFRVNAEAGTSTAPEATVDTLSTFAVEAWRLPAGALVALVVVLVAATGFATLCWLTPARRRRTAARRRRVAEGRRARRRPSAGASVRIGGTDDVPATAAVLADRLGGPRHRWDAELDTLSCAALTVRDLRPDAAEELVGSLTAAGADSRIVATDGTGGPVD